MPRMTGDELARSILAVRPDIPIILCTGFSEKVTADETLEIGVKRFLLKPARWPKLSGISWTAGEARLEPVFRCISLFGGLVLLLLLTGPIR